MIPIQEGSKFSRYDYGEFCVLLRYQVNGSRQKQSPKNSPKLQGQKDVKEPVLAASQYLAKINFLLEHLSSFTLKNFQESQVPPRDRLQQTKILLANGNQWTKEMEMRLTDSDVVLLDGETQDVIEVFPLSTIGHVHHFSDDPDLNSVLVFNTIQTEHKFGAVHLFQSDRVPAMPNKFASRGGVMLPPPPIHPAPAPPQVDQERLDLYEKSLVAQTIAAFSAVSENADKKTSKPQITSRYQASESSDIPDDTLSAEILEARTNRDVQILNHCIDDIENLIMQTKRSAEAWKKLQKKKGKKKHENFFTYAIEAIPAFCVVDVLVHYSPQRAGGVVTPLLSSQAVELLENCLSLKEKEVWKALGPNWNMTKSSVQFKDQFFPPYTPVFKDGWLPPYVIAGKDVSNVSAAIAANAAAVAQLNDEQRKHQCLSVCFSPTKKGLRRVRVLFDFQARNSKELTVHRGEEVAPKKTEISQVSSSRPHPEDDGGVPRVELRPVRLGKLNRPVSAPPVGQLVMPPAPPSNPPPSPPSSTSTTITLAPLAIVTSNGTVEKEGVNKTTEVSDFTKAIQAKNLKKVDAEAEKKRGREDTQQNKKSSTDKINDELKRRMTSSQDGVTPRTQRKESQQVVNLSPDSKAGEVKKWLISKGFSERLGGCPHCIYFPTEKKDR
ncbi:Epidermal growth factor receptor kinase substrate 8 [Acropora cervicornis]|uniref:Epidermal growth factor receptor kinase substrate 8 n=1 Tax=Acropora cervicornis TaxID=6130 RepID=A0AAD9VBD4_ACRCE|nr:Epidermal growth factor receptor kinase substrate 8 [Acropora cervicornis]